MYKSLFLATSFIGFIFSSSPVENNEAPTVNTHPKMGVAQLTVDFTFPCGNDDIYGVPYNVLSDLEQSLQSQKSFILVDAENLIKDEAYSIFGIKDLEEYDKGFWNKRKIRSPVFKDRLLLIESNPKYIDQAVLPLTDYMQEYCRRQGLDRVLVVHMNLGLKGVLDKHLHAKISYKVYTKSAEIKMQGDVEYTDGGSSLGAMPSGSQIKAVMPMFLGSAVPRMAESIKWEQI